MWSLFNKKESVEKQESLVGGIFDYSSEELGEHSGDKLEPLKFSNSKTQADVVSEVLKEIENGNKIIFIKGVCGTGKSAIALNLARHFKKTSVIVPIKSLQKQYEEDYTRKMFILKKDKKQLMISVIKGRNNFECPFLGGCADSDQLPCTIEIREKNMEMIRKFLEMNEDVSKLDFSSISDVRRMSIAPVCPYWSPLLPSEVSSKSLEKARKRKYMSVCGKEFSLFQRKRGCKYYDQYEAYADSDVLIFNSQKYILETVMGRKPKTDLEIIDECDEFLDNFANENTINLNRLLTALSNLFPDTREKKEAIKKMIHQVNFNLFGDYDEGIKKIKETTFLELIESIVKNPHLAEDEEENYYNKVFEIAKIYEHFLDETYISFSKTNKSYGKQKTLFGEFKKQEESVYATLVTINLAKRFQEIIDANNVLVLMSGTLHSEQVLKDIFGLTNFKVVEAETTTPGTIVKYRTGLEKNCKYENFRSGLVTRKQYLVALSTCLKNAKPPVLVHVNSFEDLPTEIEKSEFGLDNLITREKLKELQNLEKGKEIEKFKSGKTDVLFTTKCSRGVDFPGEKCNSIILTKYPYPNISSLFWKILKQEQPGKFMEFYLDKSRRELLQKIYRGLRFKEDHIILLSPDVRVLNDSLK